MAGFLCGYLIPSFQKKLEHRKFFIQKNTALAQEYQEEQQHIAKKYAASVHQANIDNQHYLDEQLSKINVMHDEQLSMLKKEYETLHVETLAQLNTQLEEMERDFLQKVAPYTILIQEKYRVFSLKQK